MIRIDGVWLATEPLDMRAGIDSALARVVKVFGAAHPHTAYLFANRRANRMKVLVHDAPRPLCLAKLSGSNAGDLEPLATRCAGAGPTLEPHWRGRHHHCCVTVLFRCKSHINQALTINVQGKAMLICYSF